MTAGRPMRSCGWGGGPSMGNHCRSIRASVLDGLPIRHDSFYRVRLFLPVSFPKTFCRLTVAVVPCAAPRFSRFHFFGRSRLDRPSVCPSSFCSMRLKVWWFIAQCSHCHVHLHVRSLSEEKVDCAELKAKYQDVCSGAEERHVSEISFV